MRATELENEAEYIQQARSSPQFETIFSAIGADVQTIDEQNSSAIRLHDTATGDHGVRVDFLYGVTRESHPVDASVNIQVYYPDEGSQETIGYLRQDNLLFKEFYTNEHLVPEYTVDNVDGDVILESRDYEVEDLLA